MRSLILALGIALLVGGVANSQEELPPKKGGEAYVIVPPGRCAGAVEIGTYKQGARRVQSRQPVKIIDICEVFVEQKSLARDKLAARCVDKVTLAPLSNWVRSDSTPSGVWPAACPRFITSTPAVPVSK